MSGKLALKWFRRALSTSQHQTVTVRQRVSRQAVDSYGQLTGDLNPIHFCGERSVAHGGLLLGYVSCVIGTRLPGPGSVVTSIEVRFKRPCPVDAEVDITVVVDRHRKITPVGFQISEAGSCDPLAEGVARVVFSSPQPPSPGGQSS